MAIRCLHILLAISVFFSTTGLVVFNCYCQAEFNKIAASPTEGLEANVGCQMFGDKCCCVIAKENQEDNCCDTKTDYIDSDLDLNRITENRIVLNLPVFSPIIPQNFIPKSIDPKLQKTAFQTYQSPFLVCDLPLLLQSFLC